jgi:hypothetical protein
MQVKESESRWSDAVVHSTAAGLSSMGPGVKITSRPKLPTIQ